MRETFITTVIKDGCHQRPDKPPHTSTGDGVPDTTSDVLRSVTAVHSRAAHKASSLLLSSKAVFVNGALENSRLLICL